MSNAILWYFAHGIQARAERVQGLMIGSLIGLLIVMLLRSAVDAAVDCISLDAACESPSLCPSTLACSVR